MVSYEVLFPPKLAFLSLTYYNSINKQLYLFAIIVIISHLIILVGTYCHYLVQTIIIIYTYFVIIRYMMLLLGI